MSSETEEAIMAVERLAEGCPRLPWRVQVARKTANGCSFTADELVDANGFPVDLTDGRTLNGVTAYLGAIDDALATAKEEVDGLRTAADDKAEVQEELDEAEAKLEKLKEQLEEETDKRKAAEEETERVREELDEVTRDYAALKDAAPASGSQIHPDEHERVLNDRARLSEELRVAREELDDRAKALVKLKEIMARPAPSTEENRKLWEDRKAIIAERDAAVAALKERSGTEAAAVASEMEQRLDRAKVALAHVQASYARVLAERDAAQVTNVELQREIVALKAAPGQRPGIAAAALLPVLANAEESLRMLRERLERPAPTAETTKAPRGRRTKP